MDNFSSPHQKCIVPYKMFFALPFFLFTLSYNLHAQWECLIGSYETVIHSISFGCQNPDIFYSAGQGVYRSTNGGELWTNISPDTSLGTNSEPIIEADPKTAGVVYYGGKGALFKSINYGESWEILVPYQLGSCSNWQNIILEFEYPILNKK